MRLTCFGKILWWARQGKAYITIQVRKQLLSVVQVQRPFSSDCNPFHFSMWRRLNPLMCSARIENELAHTQRIFMPIKSFAIPPPAQGLFERKWPPSSGVPKRVIIQVEDIRSISCEPWRNIQYGLSSYKNRNIHSKCIVIIYCLT